MEKSITTAMRQKLADPVTGEIAALSRIDRVKEMDKEEFIKVFVEGVKAMRGLICTGMRVFQAIPEECQSIRMNGGRADSICPHGFADALRGGAPGFSESTFQNGLKAASAE